MAHDWKVLVFFGFFCLSGAGECWAVQIEALDTTRTWLLAGVDFAGNEKFGRSELAAALVTQPRPWYRFWSSLSVFESLTFREDLERLRRLYEAHGFYHAEIGYDLEVNPEAGSLDAKIFIREGTPVIVADIDVSVAGQSSFPDKLPMATGAVFTEESYQRGELVLKQFYADQGYAFVESERKAEIVLDSDQAFIAYRIDPGPQGVFGSTVVDGSQTVASYLVSRELSYQEGERYSLKKIAESRDKILALDLFGTVTIAPEPSVGKSAIVPMVVRVSEKELREIRFGVGYGTEDRFRTQFEWRHNNWLGDGRRLSILVKYSSLETSGVLTFIQPYLFSPNSRGVVSLRHDRDDEDTYLLQATRFNPRLEYRFSEHLSSFVAYRLEYNQFTNVSAATESALGGVKKKGLASGPSLGLTWSTADNLLNPSKGEVVNFTLDQSPWGGGYRFYRASVEGKKYWSLGWETILASRLKVGLADAIGAEENLPLSERLYAGGEKSVRGYARRELGPKSSSNDPIGGLSLLEGSVELRRPLWQALGGALFVDFGQVSRRAFDVPISTLKFAAGFGLSYLTPVGPLRVDFGFPFAPSRGDRAYQVFFSIGASF